MKVDTEIGILTRLLDNHPAVMLLIDTSHTILWSNQAYQKTLNLPPGRLIKDKCYVKMGHSEPCFDCPVTEVLKSGDPCLGLIQLGSTESSQSINNFWIIEASAVFDTTGEISGAFIVAHDSSECDWVKQNLENKEHFIRELVETLGVIVWTCDENGVFTYVNLAVEKILGYTRNEYVNMAVSDLMHPNDYRKIEKDVPRLLQEKKGWNNVIVRWLHKNGSWRKLESSAVAIIGADGEVIGFRGIDRDVSDRLDLMAQLAQAQKMEAMGRFAGGIAHDSNNMLGVILGYCEIALDGMDPSNEIRNCLEQIKSAAGRSADLAKQLLTYARKQVTKPEVVDLNDRITKTLTLLRRLIGENIKLTWLPGKKLWPVKADHHQLDQVLSNLCINSRDAIEEVGEITISTKNVRVKKAMCEIRTGFIPGDYVLITLTDTGKGIKKEIIDHIFDPFFTTKPVGQGTGLGLSTVFGIIKQNNGFIYAFSEPGKYTSFEIFLPKYSGVITEKDEEYLDVEVQTGTESVLLVEDEQAKLEIVDLFLKRLGYNVTAMNSSKKALQLFQKNPDKFDLLLTDMVMPELRGRQLMDKMKSIKPDLKYIFMSGFISTGERGTDSPIKVSADEPLLQKPFSQKELATIIRKVLDS